MARPKDTEKLASIYRATLELVMQQGLHGLKMQAVAQFAGVATGTVYIYFRRKSDLINTLYLEVRQRAATTVRRGYQPDAPFMTGFEKVWRNYLNYLVTKPQEYVFAQQCYYSSLLTPQTLRQDRAIANPLREVLERGKREKLVLDVPTEILAAQLTGSLHEIVRSEQREQISFTPKNLQAIFAMAWNSIKR